MGRKAKFDEDVEVQKKGPGRKAKKQKDPTFKKSLMTGDDTEDKKALSHRQKQRVKKRLQKQELKQKAKKQKLQKESLKQNKANKQADQSNLRLNSDGSEGEESSENEAELSKSGVTDENSSWLQVKTTSNDSEDSDDDMDDDEYDDNDDEGEEEEEEDMLPIEKENIKLKKRKAEDDALANAELKEQMGQQTSFVFPTEEEEQMDLQDIQQRIRDVVQVLSDFSRLRDPGHPRSDYLDLLKKDLCTYYSYNEFLISRFLELFNLTELLEFLESSEIQRPLTIRANSLKTRRRDLAQALINRGVNLDPIGKWSKVGLVVFSSTVPIGATPEYLSGHYLIQGASSMLPVMALAPQEGERILDMCTAPGGKSSHIAALMKNTGTLIANDANRERLHAVVGNFHRLGVQNAVISCYDGRKFPSIIKGFDRVLLDAPCTGTGVIAKDPSVKTNKDEIDVQRCFTLQRELLLSAIDCTNAKSDSGGIIVYSTCSVLPEENEGVVDFALKKRNVKLVDTGLEFGTEGFVNYRQFRYHPTMKLTRRYYPHSHNMDGFFVAKFKKFSNTLPKVNLEQADGEEEEEIIAEDTNTPVSKKRKLDSIEESSKNKKSKKNNSNVNLNGVSKKVKKSKKQLDESNEENGFNVEGEPPKKKFDLVDKKKGNKKIKKSKSKNSNSGQVKADDDKEESFKKENNKVKKNKKNKSSTEQVNGDVKKKPKKGKPTNVSSPVETPSGNLKSKNKKKKLKKTV